MQSLGVPLYFLPLQPVRANLRLAIPVVNGRASRSRCCQSRVCADLSSEPPGLRGDSLLRGEQLSNATWAPDGENVRKTEGYWAGIMAYGMVVVSMQREEEEGGGARALRKSCDLLRDGCLALTKRTALNLHPVVEQEAAEATET